MPSRKNLEKPFDKDKDEKKERSLKITTGAKSVVTGEVYVDPNEAGWQKFYQRQAEKEKVS